VVVLTLNGKSVPTALLKGITYTIDVLVDGVTPLYVEWVVIASLIDVASGTGQIVFTPAFTVPHYITVKALKSNGTGEETIAAVNVTSRRTTTPTVTIQWDKTNYAHGERIEAVINYADPEGLAYKSISWELSRNNAIAATGTTKTVVVGVAQFGLYRLSVTAVDATGTTVEADSTVKVSGGFEIKATVVFTQPIGTMVHIGDVYSKAIITGTKQSTSLPFEVASHYQEIAFLPGTTHFKVSLADGTACDDEIVVRTKTGNWAVIGPPTGLSNESIGYDYALPSGYVVAPADYRMKAMIEIWNIHGMVATASNAVVKFQCFRAASLPIYHYTPCIYSTFPGGEGSRQRRFALVFEEVLLEVDAWNLEVPAGTPPKWYSTPIPNRFVARLAAGGDPYSVLSTRGTSLTEANLFAIYNPSVVKGDTPVEALGIYGIPKIRPFIVTFNLPNDLTLTRRVRGARGKMVVYVAAGATYPGTTLDVYINTQASPGTRNYLVPLQDVYISDQDVFLKAGEVNVDLLDYGFTLGGIVADLIYNE